MTRAKSIKKLRPWRALLLGLLALNTLAGLAKINVFRHEFAAEKALARAQIRPAYVNLRNWISWQPGNADPHSYLGRVARLALASGQTLESLEGGAPDLFAAGIGGVTRAIALNPVDAWIWFQMGEVYRGRQVGLLREEAIATALSRVGGSDGRATGDGNTPSAPGTAPTNQAAGIPEPAAAAGKGAPASPRPHGQLSAEDRLIIAATLKALDLDPQFYFYRDVLASLYWQRGLVAESREQIHESFALMPALSGHALLEDGEMLQANPDLVLAGVEAAGSRISASPALLAEARYEVSRKLERTDDAIEALIELQKLVPGRRFECDFRIALLHQQADSHRESLPYLKRVVDGDVEGGFYLRALFYSGRAHSALGEHQSAIDFFRRQLKEQPESPGVFLALAEEFRRMGDEEEAERLFLAAPRRFPDEPRTYQRLIGYLRSGGRLEEALAQARLLGRLDPAAAERLVEQIEKQRDPTL